MIELCATHFAALNPKQVVVANRTLERADLLASRFVAKTMKLSDIPEKLADFDVIVSCTASTLPILGLGMVERATRSPPPPPPPLPTPPPPVRTPPPPAHPLCPPLLAPHPPPPPT